MNIRLNPQKTALLLIAIAGLSLLGAVIWKNYETRTQYFLSGSPPAEIFTKIEPKSVPYHQIKPPAFMQSDPLIMGSITSTVGVIIYGDYADPKSLTFYKEITDMAARQKGRVRVIWHYLPANDKDGEVGYEASVLSECNRLIDPAWSAHGLLIDKSNLKRSDLEIISNQIMDAENMLWACRRDKDIQDYVRHGINLARGDGIDKAPFVFVGTQAFPSQTSSTAEILQSIQNYLR